jgi:GntR family transcriptional regulator / MocR family aminotransferase
MMLHIEIDKERKMPMHRQVYDAIRTQILEGRLKHNDKLPSTRGLSKFLGVSRNVIIESYDQLIAEGFIIPKEGSGTYVSDGAFLSSYKKAQQSPKKSIIGLRHEPDDSIIDFRTGVPNLSLFPIKRWGQIYKDICDNIDAIDLDYYEPSGRYELRYELSKYLYRSRGVVCDADQIFITTGAAQAFTLNSRILLDKDKHVIVEDPINSDIMKIISSTKATIHSIPVDHQGIVTDDLPNGIDARYIFTTPSHQYPTGGILSIKRRIKLIEYAKKSNGYIVEDDYDSEYRFSGSPISSLQSLDPERVIYVGTFSKKLFPALRIGYIVLPKVLEADFSQAKHLEDLHSPVLEQITLARFIQKGYLDRHIGTTRKFYKEKRELLQSELEKTFKDEVVVKGNLTGIHLIAQFKSYRFGAKVFEKLSDYGIKIHAIDKHTIKKGKYNDTLMLGYGNLSDENIVLGVGRMKKAFLNCCDK